MMPTNHRLAERKLIDLVRDGEWEIDENGCVWRVMLRHGLKTGGSMLIPVARRRVEKATPQGYLMVRAMRDRVRICGEAHRLVWQHLRGDISEGLVVNHKNGCKSDNRPDNLEVVSYSQNQIHAMRVLGVNPQHGEHNPAAKLSDEDVAKIIAAGVRGDRAIEVAARFGVRYQHIYRLWHRERRARPTNAQANGRSTSAYGSSLVFDD